MSDFFNYNRTGNSFAQIVGSEFSTISVGGGGGNLMQTFQWTYQQDLRAFFAIGDPNLYWIQGFPQGSITFERAVGAGGFYKGLSGKCGVINNVTLSATQGAPCATGGGGGTVVFGGAIVQSLSGRIQAGQSEVIEGATIRVTSLSA